MENRQVTNRDARALHAFMLTVGVENVVCRVHDKPMANAWERAVMKTRHPNCSDYWCEAWIDAPQLTPCVFVRRAAPAPER